MRRSDPVLQADVIERLVDQDAGVPKALGAA